MAMSESGANAMAGPVGNSPGPDSIVSVTGGEVFPTFPARAHTRPNNLPVVRSLRRFQRSFVGGKFQRGGRAAGWPCRRRNVRVFVAIPIPRAFRQPEIINDARVTFVARDGAMIERAPERFPAAPRIAPEIRLRFVARTFEQIFEFRRVSAGTHGTRGSVFRHHAGNAGIDVDARTVTVVARDIAEFVQTTTLAAADGRRTRGIEFMRQRDELREKSSDFGQHGFFAEENEEHTS